jgi:uncharacterized protein YlaN (UPF0358 family)
MNNLDCLPPCLLYASLLDTFVTRFDMNIDDARKLIGNKTYREILILLEQLEVNIT